MKEISFRDNILPLKDKLFRLALRVTLNTAEAEDVVQDTLIRVWNKREEWPQLNSIEAYCITICRNLALDRSQKKGNNQVPLDEMSLQMQSSSTPYENLTANERFDLIKKLMDELPEVQRSIMELRDIEGKSYKEIAVILNLSEEQVKVYLFRARQRIKKQYIDIDRYGL